MVYEFKASRLSKDNKIFPDKLVIDNTAKTIAYFKHHLIGYNQIKLKSDKIVSLSIHRFSELFFLSEIIISTAAGEIRANGFYPKDAIEIKRIIESIL